MAEFKLSNMERSTSILYEKNGSYHKFKLPLSAISANKVAIRNGSGTVRAFCDLDHKTVNPLSTVDGYDIQLSFITNTFNGMGGNGIEHTFHNSYTLNIYRRYGSKTNALSKIKR